MLIHKAVKILTNYACNLHKTWYNVVIVYEYYAKNKSNPKKGSDMEQQTLSRKETTLLEVLGANEPGKENIGIIREQQAWMQRRALDYLVVGLVTDLDDTEEGREQRFEAYVDVFESDLAMYREDAKKWNVDHLMNKDERLWQTQYDPDLRQEVRRKDLPSIEVCEQSFVSESVKDAPERAVVAQAARETIDVTYDEALMSAREILENKLKEIKDALPIAPMEDIEEGVKTQDVLKDELEVITSRLQVIEQISIERSEGAVAETPEAGDDESEPEEDLDAYEHQPMRVFSKVGGKALHIIGAR